MPKLTELQKGKIALNFMRMNSSPAKWRYYKRFMNNKGDVRIPGYHPLTGQKGTFNFSRASSAASGCSSPGRSSTKSLPKREKLPTIVNTASRAEPQASAEEVRKAKQQKKMQK